MTVASGVLFQIILMILLGKNEIPERLHLHGNFFRKSFLFFRQNGFGQFSVRLIGIINSRPVLAAPVISLTIDTRRIDYPQVVKINLFQRNFRLVINDMHGFRMIRNSNQLVPGRFRFSVGISGSHINYSVNPRKIFFQSPKATACQIYIFHRFHLIFTGNYFRSCRFFCYVCPAAFCIRQKSASPGKQKEHTSYDQSNKSHWAPLWQSRHFLLQLRRRNMPGDNVLYLPRRINQCGSRIETDTVSSRHLAPFI